MFYSKKFQHGFPNHTFLAAILKKKLFGNENLKSLHQALGKAFGEPRKS
jgi:hypothetical protein